MRWWTVAGVTGVLLCGLALPAVALPAGALPAVAQSMGAPSAAALHPVASPAAALPAAALPRAAVVDQRAVRDAALVAVDPEYLAAAGPAAKAVAAEYGIPASVTAAQSILESGWGASLLAVERNNYFGFKCVSGRPGPIASGCHEYPTTECTPECGPAVAHFRVYPSMAESFRDYGRLISTSKYYAHALPFADDADAFIREVAKRYATDPAYAGKVTRLMEQYDLYRLDASG